MAAPKKPRRRFIKVTLTLSVAHDVKKAEAVREVRTRVNEGCDYHEKFGSGRWAETSDVRVRSAR